MILVGQIALLMLRIVTFTFRMPGLCSSYWPVSLVQGLTTRSIIVFNIVVKVADFASAFGAEPTDFGLMDRYPMGGSIVVVIFMLIARPATVFLCALPDRCAKWSFNEMLFMCWTREIGVIPAALAGMLLGTKAPGAQMIASVTFIAILMTILIRAPTTQWLGRKID